MKINEQQIGTDSIVTSRQGNNVFFHRVAPRIEVAKRTACFQTRIKADRYNSFDRELEGLRKFNWIRSYLRAGTLAISVMVLALSINFRWSIFTFLSLKSLILRMTRRELHGVESKCRYVCVCVCVCVFVCASTYAYIANRNFRWCVRTRPGLTRFTSRVCL